MGLLDDAIREHLELKRRRGADPTEIDRAEREALGPVRRHPEPLEPGVLEAAQGAPTGTDLDLEYAEDDLDAGYDEEYDAPPAPAPGAVPARPLHAVEDEYDEEYDDQLDDDEDFEEPPRPHAAAAPPPPPPARAPEDSLGQETVEYRLGDDERLTHEDHHAAAERLSRLRPANRAPHEDVERDERGSSTRPSADQHADDVLEETPEFLQDTPDHDRLWFEQRPPRDFDFDG